VKVTFTLDADTVNRLERAAERLSKPKSQVIREAVQEYYQRIGGRRIPAEPS
jgi:predicted transcriptional regulator